MTVGPAGGDAGGPPPAATRRHYVRAIARLPLFQSLAGYDRQWLRGDLIAGLTVWAVLVPEALAYATIAGVSPVVGLYAAPPALVLYAAFGSSRHLVVGPDVRDRRAVGRGRRRPGDRRPATTSPRSPPRWRHDRASSRSLAGLLRLGFLANFISEPVLKGFIIGLALTIIIGQVPKLFGVEKEDGQLLRAAVGRHRQPRRHAGPHARRRR